MADGDDHDDDGDEHFHVDDILLGLLVLMAPEVILKNAVELLREGTSIKAGDHAADLIKTIREKVQDVDAYLKMTGEDLCPNIQGPKKPVDEILSQKRELETTLSQLLGQRVVVAQIAIDGTPEAEALKAKYDPKAFVKADEGCYCDKCKKIRDLDAKGLRLRNDGRIVAVDRLN